MTDMKLASFINKNGLSQDYVTTAERYFLPIAEDIYMHRCGAKSPVVVGINGAQGSGKSTLAELMVLLLRDKFKLNSVALSLDDFYHTKEERQYLSKTIHPLLITRGVPGTHDVSLAIKTIDDLKKQRGEVAIPRFSKAIDDRLPEHQWDVNTTAIDVVIFEGWCLGAQAQTQAQLSIAINELEQLEDADGSWRRYVNQQLKDRYTDLFSHIDLWIMLKAPSFDCVLSWRSEQETKLRLSLQQAKQHAFTGSMNEAELARFIQFYQRITEELMTTLPDNVDYLIKLDKDRTVTQLLRPKAEKANQRQQKWLIFSDMDGTLLDHYSYSHSDADDTLNRLEKNNIPVITNTSKTFAEMFVLQEELNNRHPFIIENGAAVYIPNDYFPQRPPGMLQQGDFWVKSFVQKRPYWQAIIGQLRTRYYDCFKTFAQLGPKQIAELTGLSAESSYRSSQRKYSEPIIWTADSALKRKFINELRELGANVLIGGRFIHVSGHSDKGVAMKWLCDQYQTAYQDTVIKSLAVGDGQNDAAMLEQADLAILIRSPVHDLPVLSRTKGCYISDYEGPKGWSQSVEKFMRNYIKVGHNNG